MNDVYSISFKIHLKAENDVIIGTVSAFIFNFLYAFLKREKETVRDRFFRVLWIATLIWKLSDYPTRDHEAQLDAFHAEAKFTNPDGTLKLPRKRKATEKPDDSTEKPDDSTEKQDESTEKPEESRETFEKIKIKMKFPDKRRKK